MRLIAHPPSAGIYRSRNPRASPLYQCVARHRDELTTAGLIARSVETEVIERFLDCGDLVTFNPHIHALVADGVFMPSGTFRVLPPLPADALAEALRHKVLAFLCAEGRLDPGLAGRMLQWRHSGFSVHNQVRIKAHDDAGRRRLARYMIRNPFALAKMSYDPGTTMVIYRSQMHATLKRNYQLMPALKWLRLLLNHIPDKYEHLVRYYGYYSNRSRGARRRAEPQTEEHTQITVDNRPPDWRCKANWARLIQKVVAPGHPWPPRHWHIPVRHMKLIRSSARTAARPCASSR